MLQFLISGVGGCWWIEEACGSGCWKLVTGWREGVSERGEEWVFLVEGDCKDL
jgi:hypothetical protein